MASRCGACSTRPPRTASDETCHTQQQQVGNNGSAYCANQGSDYPAVLTASDPLPGSNIEEQGISFAAVKVRTRDVPSKEQRFWQFGPTGEVVASLGTSGLFSGFGCSTSENTGSSIFEIKEGTTQGLGLWNHITGGLAAIMGLFGALFNFSGEQTINSGAQAPGTRIHITGTLTLWLVLWVMGVMLHYVWFTLSSFLYNRVASTNTNGQPEAFGGITKAKDGLALATVPVVKKWNLGSNSLVSAMVDRGASVHCFDDALVPELRYRF